MLITINAKTELSSTSKAVTQLESENIKNIINGGNSNFLENHKFIAVGVIDGETKANVNISSGSKIKVSGEDYTVKGKDNKETHIDALTIEATPSNTVGNEISAKPNMTNVETMSSTAVGSTFSKIFNAYISASCITDIYYIARRELKDREQAIQGKLVPRNPADKMQWDRADDRFKLSECEKKWQTFYDNGGLTIATLHDFASKLYGYSEKAFQRDWYATHNPNPNPRIIHRPPDAQELSAKLAELQTQPQSKKRDAEIISVIRDLCTWNYKKDELGQVFKSTIKNTIRNAELIFENDPNLVGLFGFDNFQGKNIFLKKAPWHDDDKTGEIWRDSDDAELRNYLRRNYAELKERQLINRAVRPLALAMGI